MVVPAFMYVDIAFVSTGTKFVRRCKGDPAVN